MGGAGGLAEQEGREGAEPDKALLEVYTIRGWVGGGLWGSRGDSYLACWAQAFNCAGVWI
jgi:hypothetical protein